MEDDVRVISEKVKDLTDNELVEILIHRSKEREKGESPWEQHNRWLLSQINSRLYIATKDS